MSDPKPLADGNIIYWHGHERAQAARIAEHVRAIQAMPEYRGLLDMLRRGKAYGQALDVVLDRYTTGHDDMSNT